MKAVSSLFAGNSTANLKFAYVSDFDSPVLVLAKDNAMTGEKQDDAIQGNPNAKPSSTDWSCVRLQDHQWIVTSGPGKSAPKGAQRVDARKADAQNLLITFVCDLKLLVS